MKVGVDLDGVTVDWDTAWRKIWNKTQIGCAPVPAQGNGNWDAPFEDTGLTPENFWLWADRLRTFERAKPIEGAIDALHRLANSHEIHFITNRHWRNRAATIRWMETWKVDRFDLHFARQKVTVECDIYVDDSPEVLKELQRHGKRHIKFDQPWNRCLYREHTAYNWDDVEDILEQ